MSAQKPRLITAARAGGIWAVSPEGFAVNAGRVIRRFDAGGWHEQLQTTPWTPNSMRPDVTTMLADHAGRVWIGMLRNGIWFSDGDGGWQQIQDEGPLIECEVTCLHEDRQGAVWIGTDREGLQCVSRRPVTTLKLPAE